LFPNRSIKFNTGPNGVKRGLLCGFDCRLRMSRGASYGLKNQLQRPDGVGALILNAKRHYTALFYSRYHKYVPFCMFGRSKDATKWISSSKRDAPVLRWNLKRQQGKSENVKSVP